MKRPGKAGAQTNSCEPKSVRWQLDNDEDNDYARWSGVFEAKEDFPMQMGIGNYTR